MSFQDSQGLSRHILDDHRQSLVTLSQKYDFAPKLTSFNDHSSLSTNLRTVPGLGCTLFSRLILNSLGGNVLFFIHVRYVVTFMKVIATCLCTWEILLMEIICVGFSICVPHRSTGNSSGHSGSYTIVSQIDRQRH